ncbi:unnamed protein product [Schistocephalus solidus]|uniref:Protein kinase domain-containing protein n=1 Tax=Schistocephalus solidus TaxID=70667 RepID=A0A3P7C8J2_SCHSO|nr:unnamed protein product [Schistocephalus solidus]
MHPRSVNNLGSDLAPYLLSSVGRWPDQTAPYWPPPPVSLEDRQVLCADAGTPPIQASKPTHTLHVMWAVAIRLLTFFMSIEKVVVSEISGREGRRYQVKLILANDPEAGQPIIFTFDSRTVADTVAHTVEGYCRLARPEAKQPDRPLLIWGCPFRTHLYHGTFPPSWGSHKSSLPNTILETRTAGKMTADGEPTLVRSQITLERVLGEGQFGDVYKGAYRPAGPNSSVLPVAVKACKVGLSADDKKRCLEEADLHGKLCHPHIIKLYGACKDEPVWLVLEFAGEGELRHHLIERQDRIPLAILVTYCHQLASALAYIEAMRIIHRDVAARNVLVANETCVKLADFGMARQLGELDYYVAEPGRKVPIKWMAPESLQSRIFSSASDVWMFGVCMWEILSFGLKPFSNLTNAEAVEHVANGERLSRPAICIPILYRLMLECWLKDPVLRPTFASLQPKLREILSEVKRISLEKAAGLSAPSTESTSDRYKEPGSAGSQQVGQLGPNRSPDLPLTPSSPTNHVFLPRTSTNGSETVDPLYRAVFCVVEALQEIIRKPVVPKPRELVKAVQNVGQLIRSMYVMIQSAVEPINDISEVDLAERNLNDSFRFLIEDLMTLWKSFADENKFRNELYQRFLSQAYVVAAESRAVYQSVQRCSVGP